MSRPRRPLLAARLPLPLLIAWRYLRSTRRDAHARFLATVATFGIALGVAALVLALSALAGFQQALTDEVLERTPHLEIELPDGQDLEGVRASLAQVPGVVAAHRVTEGSGWLLSDGRARPVRLVGVSPTVPPTFPGLSGSSPGLYVGDRLAVGWGLAPGEVLEVASSRPTLTPIGPQPRVRRIELAGLYRTGRLEESDRLVVPLADALALSGARAQRLQVTTSGLERALALVPELRQRLPEGTRVVTWQELNQPLFFALKLEKLLMFVAVFLVVLVGALGLVSEIALVVAAKRPEIGVLLTIGAPRAAIRNAFLWLGGLLAGGGVATGVACGVLGAWLLDRYELLSLPGGAFLLDSVPFLIRPVELAAVAALTFVLSLACALQGARRASAVDPVEALRR